MLFRSGRRRQQIDAGAPRSAAIEGKVHRPQNHSGVDLLPSPTWWFFGSLGLGFPSPDPVGCRRIRLNNPKKEEYWGFAATTATVGVRRGLSGGLPPAEGLTPAKDKEACGAAAAANHRAVLAVGVVGVQEGFVVIFFCFLDLSVRNEVAI